MLAWHGACRMFRAELIDQPLDTRRHSHRGRFAVEFAEMLDNGWRHGLKTAQSVVRISWSKATTLKRETTTKGTPSWQLNRISPKQANRFVMAIHIATPGRAGLGNLLNCLRW